MERLIDTAAREMGIDQVEMRRRNHIKPEEMPLQDRVGHGLRQRRVHRAARQGAEARRRRRLRRAQGREQGARQAARPGHRRLSRGHRAADEGDGRHPLRAQRRRHHHHRHARLRPGPLVGLRPGADRRKLGIPFEKIKLIQGDSDLLIAGGGTGGSKSIMASGRGDRRSLRQGDRQGQADRRRRARSLGRRHRVQAPAASPSSAPTAASASWSWPSGCAAA